MLWAMMDANQIRDSKIFWVFMEMNIRMGINHNPWLSLTFYNNLQSFIEFKADFHHIYLRMFKDPMKKWNELPYMVIDDVIFDVLETWLPEWYAPYVFALENSVVSKREEEEKLRVV